MQISQQLASVFIVLVICHHSEAFTVTRGKEYRGSSEVAGKDGVNAEPSCEELKAMWRFSKRQSRAAEITNEIPTYRDPFSYNVWEPYYARSRSVGGMRIGNRYRGRPIYGRVVHKAPMLRIHDAAERNRAFEEVAQMYGTVQRATEPRRRVTAFRLSGGGHIPSMGLTPQSGSFQHLKELIRTERARELQEQRMAEEAAARAAALKELSGSAHRTQPNLRDLNYYDVNGRQERESLASRGGLLANPDLMDAAVRADSDETRYGQDQMYFRDRPKSHSSSLFDSSSFNDDYNGFLL